MQHDARSSSTLSLLDSPSVTAHCASAITSPAHISLQSSSTPASHNSANRSPAMLRLAEPTTSIELRNQSDEDQEQLDDFAMLRISSRSFPSLPDNRDSARTLQPLLYECAPSESPNGPQEPSLVDLAQEIEDATQTVQDIRNHIFLVQEQRHSAAFSKSSLNAVENDTREHNRTTLDALDVSLMRLDESLEGASRQLQQLEARVPRLFSPEAYDDIGDTSIIDKDRFARRQRGRADSDGSINSLSSFEDFVLPSSDTALTPKVLQARHRALNSDWESVKQDADTLKSELLDDRYLDVFRTVSEQAEGMMGSLDKAVTISRAFLSQLNRDYQAGLMHTASETALELDCDIKAKSEELLAIARTFTVKKLHYVPACQQVFSSLDKSSSERHTANGSLLRRLADLKARWKLLREALEATERDIRRAELLLEHIQSDTLSSPSALRQTLTNNLHLNTDTPTRVSGGSRINLNASRIASGPSKLSSSISLKSDLSSASPPMRRMRTVSATAEALGTRKESAVTPSRMNTKLKAPISMPVQRQRPLTETALNTDPPQHNRVLSQAKTGKGAAETGVLGKGPRSPVNGPKRAPVSKTSSPVQHGPSSYRSSWLGLDNMYARPSTTPKHVTRSPQSVAASQSRKYESSVSDFDGDNSVEYMQDAPSRPGSSAGQYYRPPSAQGSVGDVQTRKRHSLIPRLSVSAAEEQHVANRPSSALSQASHSTPARYSGASRLSMQTPEPMIMARAQRLNIYARAPSSGSSRMLTCSNTTPSKSASRPPSTKRNSVLSSGRMTLLSAAALASIPSAEPGALFKRASIQDLRSARMDRATPTMSENGSVSGTRYVSMHRVGSSRVGSGSVAGSSYGPQDQYMPNPNDTLDLEVAGICNALGVAVERIDAPLPRGMRLEEGPGKDNRTRYMLGGQDVICRLLELHRPAGSAGARAGTKAKKILVRVGGGWQDLEQWLLGRLSSI